MNFFIAQKYFHIYLSNNIEDEFHQTITTINYIY